MPDSDEMPPAPPTIPATPYAKELSEVVERIVGALFTKLETKLDALEAKIDHAAALNKILYDKLVDIERKQNDHDARIERLEAHTWRDALPPIKKTKRLSDKSALKRLTGKHKKRG
jgi:hypothetical protein